MKCVLLGATGLLGYNLLTAPSPIRWVPTFWRTTLAHDEAFKLDLGDTKNIRRMVEAATPDVIIHVAGITKPDQCEVDPELSNRINVQAAAEVVRAAKACGARLIFLSSDLVFDGTKQGSYGEHDPVRPTTVYGWQKVAVEDMIRAELHNYLIIRTGILFGCGSPSSPSFAEWIVLSLEHQKTVKLFSDQWRNTTFVGDMCAFIIEQANSSQSGIVHFASPQCVSKLDLGLEIAERFGLLAEHVVGTCARTFRRKAQVPERIKLDVSYASIHLRIVARGLREGVAAFFAQHESRHNQRNAQPTNF